MTDMAPYGHGQRNGPATPHILAEPWRFNVTTTGVVAVGWGVCGMGLVRKVTPAENARVCLACLDARYRELTRTHHGR